MPAADAVGARLQHNHALFLVHKGPRRRQASHAGSNDDHISSVGLGKGPAGGSADVLAGGVLGGGGGRGAAAQH